MAKITITDLGFTLDKYNQQYSGTAGHFFIPRWQTYLLKKNTPESYGFTATDTWDSILLNKKADIESKVFANWVKEIWDYIGHLGGVFSKNLELVWVNATLHAELIEQISQCLSYQISYWKLNQPFEVKSDTSIVYNDGVAFNMNSSNWTSGADILCVASKAILDSELYFLWDKDLSNSENGFDVNNVMTLQGLKDWILANVTGGGTTLTPEQIANIAKVPTIETAVSNKANVSLDNVAVPTSNAGKLLSVSQTGHVAFIDAPSSLTPTQEANIAKIPTIETAVSNKQDALSLLKVAGTSPGSFEITGAPTFTSKDDSGVRQAPANNADLADKQYVDEQDAKKVNQDFINEQINRIDAEIVNINNLVDKDLYSLIKEITYDEAPLIGQNTGAQALEIKILFKDNVNFDHTLFVATKLSAHIILRTTTTVGRHATFVISGIQANKPPVTGLAFRSSVFTDLTGNQCWASVYWEVGTSAVTPPLTNKMTIHIERIDGQPVDIDANANVTELVGLLLQLNGGSGKINIDGVAKLDLSNVKVPISNNGANAYDVTWVSRTTPGDATFRNISIKDNPTRQTEIPSLAGKTNEQIDDAILELIKYTFDNYTLALGTTGTEVEMISAAQMTAYNAKDYRMWIDNKLITRITSNDSKIHLNTADGSDYTIDRSGITGSLGGAAQAIADGTVTTIRYTNDKVVKAGDIAILGANGNLEWTAITKAGIVVDAYSKNDADLKFLQKPTAVGTYNVKKDGTTVSYEPAISNAAITTLITAQTGDLTTLNTQAKDTLVNAINDVHTREQTNTGKIAAAETKLNDKLDKPTSDGTFNVKRNGTTITYEAAAGGISKEEIAIMNLQLADIEAIMRGYYEIVVNGTGTTPFKYSTNNNTMFIDADANIATWPAATAASISSIYKAFLVVLQNGKLVPLFAGNKVVTATAGSWNEQAELQYTDKTEYSNIFIGAEKYKLVLVKNNKNAVLPIFQWGTTANTATEGGYSTVKPALINAANLINLKEWALKSDVSSLAKTDLSNLATQASHKNTVLAFDNAGAFIYEPKADFLFKEHSQFGNDYLDSWGQTWTDKKIGFSDYFDGTNHNPQLFFQETTQKLSQIKYDRIEFTDNAWAARKTILFNDLVKIALLATGNLEEATATATDGTVHTYWMIKKV